MAKQTSVALVLDFDRVLFDTDGHNSGLLDAVRGLGVSRAMWDKAYDDRDEDGVFRIERFTSKLAVVSGKPPEELKAAIDRETAEAIWYLYPDSRDFLERFTGRTVLYLLTFGCQHLQRQKIAAVGLGRYFESVTVVEKPKAESGQLPISSVQQAIFINDNFQEMYELARLYRWATHLHINRMGAELPADFPFPSYRDLASAGDAIEALLADRAQTVG